MTTTSILLIAVVLLTAAFVIFFRVTSEDKNTFNEQPPIEPYEPEGKPRKVRDPLDRR